MAPQFSYRLNLLIAIMSSTYEAALDIATVEFKVYKVSRIVELKRLPRLPGPYYFIECALFIPLGMLLRLCGKRPADYTSSRSPLAALLDAGWRDRPAFKWEKPKWKPKPEILKVAKEALEEAKQDLRGGWESTTKAARAYVRRMQQRRGGGIATSKGVHAIVKVEVGAVHAALDAKHAALSAKVASVENKLDAIMEILKKK